MRSHIFELQLWCDACLLGDDPMMNHDPAANDQGTGSYLSNTVRGAYKEARGDGWKLGRRTVCPACARAGRR